LRERDVEIAVYVGMVQVIGRVQASAPRHLYLVIALPIAQVASVLVLHGRLQRGQRSQVPAGALEVGFDRALLVSALHEADPLCSGSVEQDGGRQDHVGMHLVSLAGRQAKYLLPWVAGEVYL